MSVNEMMPLYLLSMSHVCQGVSQVQDFNVAHCLETFQPDLCVSSSIVVCQF